MTPTPIHVMLDLETWGTRAGCDIRSIGAVVFDPTAASLGTTFYRACDNPPGYWGTGAARDRFFKMPPQRTHTRKYPLHRDAGTVAWWDRQGNEARAAFKDKVDLADALRDFRAWLGDVLETDHPEACDRLRLWSKGPHFDVAILEAAYFAVRPRIKVPWHYRSPRDCRTIFDMVGGVHLPFEGVEHHALDDAAHQARCVIKAFEWAHVAVVP